MKKIVDEFMETGSKYIELMNKTEKIKRVYDGIELFPSEIHTLVFIKDNIEYNMTDIAKRLGITKGAIFKIINKLEKKELLIRIKKEGNNKNTYFKLTSKGLKAYKAHEDFHANFFDSPSSELLEFANENEEVLLKGLKLSKEYLENHLKKIEMDISKDE